MADLVRGKGKKGLIIKTWERCRCFGSTSSSALIRRVVLVRKSSSRWWPAGRLRELVDKYYCVCGKKRRVAPEGCFSVYVGKEKQRFVIKTEYVNHPLFKVLLEEAESEYGYSSEGPLVLPCDVQVFVKVLVEMDDGYDDNEIHRQAQAQAQAQGGLLLLCITTFYGSSCSYHILRS